MKKFLLTFVLIGTISISYAQKVFQSGNYKGQSQRTYLTLEGRLLEKYQHKGFLWFVMEKQEELVYVSVVNQERFDTAAINQKIILSDCFKLDSKAWKRKNQKSVVLAKS